LNSSALPLVVSKRPRLVRGIYPNIRPMGCGWYDRINTWSGVQ